MGSLAWWPIGESPTELVDGSIAPAEDRETVYQYDRISGAKPHRTPSCLNTGLDPPVPNSSYVTAYFEELQL